MATEKPRQEGETSALEAINSKIAEAAAAGDYESVAALVQEAKGLQAAGERLTEEHFSKEDEVLSGEIYQRQAEEARIRAEAQRTADLAKAQELLSEIHEEHGVAKSAEESGGLSDKARKLLDEMPKDGMYEGTFLSYDVPDELKANAEFMLEVAKSNPSAALAHASEALKHNKDFITALIQVEPASGNYLNFSQVNFYNIERECPEFLLDKDLVKLVISRERSGVSSVRAEMLNDPEIFEMVCQKGVKLMVDQAKELTREGKIFFPHFKLRDDGQTIGGERWFLSNSQEFVKMVVAELNKLGKVREDSQEEMAESGRLFFEPNL